MSVQRLAGQASGTAARLDEIGPVNFAPYLMNSPIGRHNASLRDEMAGLSLTTPKMRALAVLLVIDGPLIRDLAVYAVVDPSTLSRALDGLVAEGLVRREPAAQEKRGTRVHLTEAGRLVFETFWPHTAEAHERMFRGVPEAERRAFAATRQTMLSNIRKHEI